MQIVRKNVTSDPFIIYECYDMLNNEIEHLGIQDRPECIFNCDESSFPSDLSRLRHVCHIGKKSIQVTYGANRENTVGSV